MGQRLLANDFDQTWSQGWMLVTNNVTWPTLSQSLFGGQYTMYGQKILFPLPYMYDILTRCTSILAIFTQVNRYNCKYCVEFSVAPLLTQFYSPQFYWSPNFGYFQCIMRLMYIMCLLKFIEEIGTINHISMEREWIDLSDETKFLVIMQIIW